MAAPTDTKTEQRDTSLERRVTGFRNSLLAKVFLTNAVLFIVAGAALALTPATISKPITLGEAVLLVVGLSAMLVVDLFLMRRTFAPLNRLREVMGQVDPLRPGPRVPVEELDAEIADLMHAFNEMVDRLEVERRKSTVRALAAQEGERRRVAQELHDEIGQSLTALLLLLEGVRKDAGEQVTAEVDEASEAARSALDDLRRIVQRLRPEALDELGLTTALLTLGDRVSAQAGLHVVQKLDPRVRNLDPDAELVIYRIAQESLTNVVRHAEATKVELSLERVPGGVLLRVSDDGCGMNGSRGIDGSGIRGMRERALLVHADITLGEARDGGVEVRLNVPLAEEVRA
jgi:two-component system sensor histidine kinase UhpB